MKTTLRYLLGYLLGFILFIGVVPYLQYRLSIKEFTSFNDSLFGSDLLRIAFSIPVFLSGILFAIWSNLFLAEKGEGGPFDLFNTSISPRSKKLVVIGPYRYSRNPMVFGAVCLYTGVGIYLNSISSLLIAAGFLIFMVVYIKLFEEKRLLKDFGNDYLDYKKKVPMIFPIPNREK